MGRKPKVIRPKALCLKLPEDLLAKLALHLYSDIEGRVPQNAYQQFFIDRLQEYFSSAPLKQIREFMNASGLAATYRIPRSLPEAAAILREIQKLPDIDKSTSERIDHMVSLCS